MLGFCLCFAVIIIIYQVYSDTSGAGNGGKSHTDTEWGQFVVYDRKFC